MSNTENIAEARRKKHNFVLFRDLKPKLDSKDIIDGLLPRRAIGVVYAEPSAGKTAIIVDLVLHIAAGIEYRNRMTELQPIIYVALEGQEFIANRAIAAATELGLEDQDLPFGIHYSRDDFRARETADKIADLARDLMAEYKSANPIVIIDTMTPALGPGGNDCRPEDVSNLIENCKRLIEIGCTVIIIHHCGKDASRGARGWSGLLGACDFELEIDRKDDLRTMSVSKMRDGSDNQPTMHFELHGLEIGINTKTGRPVTAVVVKHLADGEGGSVKRHSPKARAVLSILWECIKNTSRSFPMSDQKGLRCVLLRDLEAACIAPGAISNCKQERDRRVRFNDAMDELSSTNAVVQDGQRIYPKPRQPRQKQGESGAE